MDPFDKPSTRNRVFANAGDSVEPPASSQLPVEASKRMAEGEAQVGGTQADDGPGECQSQALPADPDVIVASTAAEAPASAVAPAPADSSLSLENPIDNHINANDSPIDNARLEKIANIKKALADGTYNVSAEELARKLIEHMLEP